MGQEHPPYKLIRDWGMLDVTVYDTEFGLRIRGADTCNTQSVGWVDRFVCIDAKRHCISQSKLERYSDIYEGLVMRRLARIISSSYRQRSSVTKYIVVVRKESKGESVYKTHLEVSQLPHAGHNQHHDLSHAVPHRSRIRDLAQIPKIRLPLPLILLLPPNVLELDVQLSNLGSDFRDVRTVVVEVRAYFTDCDVEVHSDMRGRGKPGRVDPGG